MGTTSVPGAHDGRSARLCHKKSYLVGVKVTGEGRDEWGEKGWGVRGER